MKIGLVSYRCENKNIDFNLSQIKKALDSCKNKVDLLCFSEAFIQGFDCLTWDYEIDKEMAISKDSIVFDKLKKWSIEYGIALLTGYIEKDNDDLYSSCVVIDKGEIVYNYRRISTGWKESDKTNNHYKEGSVVEDFYLDDIKIRLVLCGDLWEYPNKYITDGLLIWPIYCNYSIEQWNDSELLEYAKHAGSITKDVLMINSIDNNPVNHGGAFYFSNGKIVDRTDFDLEDILIVEMLQS